MKTKHTGDKWKAIVANPDKNYWKVMNGLKRIAWIEGEKAEANAKLIAAAPEMKKTIDTTLDLVNELLRYGSPSLDISKINKLRNELLAIKNATS